MCIERIIYICYYIFYYNKLFIYAIIANAIIKFEGDESMTTSFKGKIWKFGRTHVMTVPIQYIRDGHLQDGAHYDVTLEATEDAEDAKAEN